MLLDAVYGSLTFLSIECPLQSKKLFSGLHNGVRLSKTSIINSQIRNASVYLMLPIAVLIVLLLLTRISLVMLFSSHGCVVIEFYNDHIQASKTAKVARLFLIKTMFLILKMKRHGVHQHNHLPVVG